MKSLFALPGLLLMLVALPASAADPADPQEGRQLVDSNCNSCHQSEVYTRKNRRVKDLDQLRTQVRRCEFSLDLRWFDDQIENVTNYLNEQYYKFK